MQGGLNGRFGRGLDWKPERVSIVKRQSILDLGLFTGRVKEERVHKVRTASIGAAVPPGRVSFPERYHSVRVKADGGGMGGGNKSPRPPAAKLNPLTACC